MEVVSPSTQSEAVATLAALLAGEKTARVRLLVEWASTRSSLEPSWLAQKSKWKSSRRVEGHGGRLGGSWGDGGGGSGTGEGGGDGDGGGGEGGGEGERSFF